MNEAVFEVNDVIEYSSAAGYIRAKIEYIKYQMTAANTIAPFALFVIESIDGSKATFRNTTYMTVTRQNAAAMKMIKVA